MMSYWPIIVQLKCILAVIGNLVGVLAYHCPFLLYDVIFKGTIRASVIVFYFLKSFKKNHFLTQINLRSCKLLSYIPYS